MTVKFPLFSFQEGQGLIFTATCPPISTHPQRCPGGSCVLDKVRRVSVLGDKSQPAPGTPTRSLGGLLVSPKPIIPDSGSSGLLTEPSGSLLFLPCPPTSVLSPPPKSSHPTGIHPETAKVAALD